MEGLQWRRLRAALILATALGPAALPLHAEPEPPTTASKYSEEQLHLLYDEATAIGTQTYAYYMFGTDDEDAVRELDKKLQPEPASPRAALTSAAKLELQKLRAFAAPARLREQLQLLGPGETSAVFQPDKTHWAIIQLESVDTKAHMPTFEMVRSSLPQLVDVGALPEPEPLRSDPALVERSLMNKVNTTAEFDRLPPGFFIDRPLSSGYTLLQRMLARDQVDMVKAVLTRGANPNLCLARACPLQLALNSKEHSGLFTSLLLEAGAKPDQMPAASQQNTPLAIASLNGNLEAARYLLAKGADPDGRLSTNAPLNLALYNGNRELAQLLLDKGADPLQRRPVPSADLFATPIMTAYEAKKPEVAAWFRAAAQKKFATRHDLIWSGWIEQEVEVKVPRREPGSDPSQPPVMEVVKQTRRYPLKAGARITLQRKPFRLQVRLAPQATLRLEASTTPQLLDEPARDSLDAPLFRRARVQTDNGHGEVLLVADGKARAAAPDHVGGVLDWSPAQKAFASVEKSTQGNVYGRRISRLKVDDGSADATELPLEKSRLREIDLVIGTAVDYSGQLGDIANVQKVKLVFGK